MITVVNFMLRVFHHNKEVEKRRRFEYKKLCTFYFYVNYNSQLYFKMRSGERIFPVANIVAFLTNL